MPPIWMRFRDFSDWGSHIGPFTDCQAHLIPQISQELKAQQDTKRSNACCTRPENGKSFLFPDYGFHALGIDAWVFPRTQKHRETSSGQLFHDLLSANWHTVLSSHILRTYQFLVSLAKGTQVGRFGKRIMTRAKRAQEV